MPARQARRAGAPEAEGQKQNGRDEIPANANRKI
jgi:hypothetical protein